MRTSSVRATVEVAVDPDSAFRMFTEDLHAWYRVDEFTVPDPSKTVALRFEPRVGGRFLDVHDEATGEGRTIGTITAWEPGSRILFVDSRDSEVEVTFLTIPGGTRVQIEQRGIDKLPKDVSDHVQRYGWHTVAARFGAYAGGASEAPKPADGGLVIYVFYDDAAAMMEWYARVFGFVEIARWCGTDGRVHNGEMRAGTSELWLDGSGPRYFDKDGKRAAPWIGLLVEDVDAVYERIRAAGVDADPPIDTSYGVRMLTVKDPEGNSWGFTHRGRA